MSTLLLSFTRLTYVHSGMQAALRMLGLHDVYHMQSLVESPDDSKLWIRAMDAKLYGKGKFDREDWDELLGGYQVRFTFLLRSSSLSPLQATPCDDSVHGLIHDTYQAVCDAPAALFGVELAAAYPEAKIVILNREIDPWYKSCLNTIQEVRSSVSIVQVILLILDWSYLAHYARCIKKMQKEALGFEWPEEGKAKAFFHNYYKECREKISKERVLEYKIQDGWGPLCKHLGVEVPKMLVEGREEIVPFPRVNDAMGFKESVDKILKVSRWRAYRNATMILGVFVGLGFISWKWRPS